jgi:hypothetical protein
VSRQRRSHESSDNGPLSNTMIAESHQATTTVDSIQLTSNRQILDTRRDKTDTLPDHHVGHEVHIGSDNSSQFKQSPPSPERWPRNAKRDNDGAGLDKSWVMKQPHNAVQAITHRIWGGTNEGRTTDSCVTTCVVNPHATICVVKPHTTICVVNSHLAICVVNPREDKT